MMLTTMETILLHERIDIFLFIYFCNHGDDVTFVCKVEKLVGIGLLCN